MADEDQPEVSAKVKRQFEEGIPKYPIQHPPWASNEAAGQAPEPETTEETPVDVTAEVSVTQANKK